MNSQDLQLVHHLLNQSGSDPIKYWWVNHKQTFKQEIEGGYIWSPKQNRNGSRNQTYLNLPRTKVGDFVFSYARGRIQALGVVSALSQSTQRPVEFGKLGIQWDPDGWLVSVAWVHLEEPLEPRNHLGEIAPLLPKTNSPLKPNGMGNQGCYLAGISDELGKVLLGLSKGAAVKALEIALGLRNSALDDQAQLDLQGKNIPPLEKQQLINARRGQGIFRSNLEHIERSCRLTGVSDKRFLIASHIKPWRKSNNDEKLDGNNGLLLSPHVDKLFDNGWITFDKKLKTICSSEEVERLMTEWGLDLRKNVGSFNNHQLEFLEYHRENVFKA